MRLRSGLESAPIVFQGNHTSVRASWDCCVRCVQTAAQGALVSECEYVRVTYDRAECDYALHRELIAQMSWVGICTCTVEYQLRTGYDPGVSVLGSSYYHF